MKALLPLLLLTGAAAPADHPRSYLLSLHDLPLLKDTESLSGFSIATWGVTFNAVCRIPPGWRIKAGGAATPDGELDGTGSHGVTWFRERNPKELRNFVLVTLYAPVQRRDIRTDDGGSVIPATFKGYAAVETPDSDTTRKRPLDWRNMTLTPASRCP